MMEWIITLISCVGGMVALIAAYHKYIIDKIDKSNERLVQKIDDGNSKLHDRINDIRKEYVSESNFTRALDALNQRFDDLMLILTKK